MGIVKSATLALLKCPVSTLKYLQNQNHVHKHICLLNHLDLVFIGFIYSFH